MSDKKWTSSCVVWNDDETEINVVGSGFVPGEAVSLTMVGTEYDVSLASASANEHGGFSVDFTLDPAYFDGFAGGWVNAVVATGDQGSRAFTALLVIREVLTQAWLEFNLSECERVIGG